jgi:hypothetical protein
MLNAQCSMLDAKNATNAKQMPKMPGAKNARNDELACRLYFWHS